MMRTLFIVRHAKSNWNDPGVDDIDRPLNKRGYRDAGLIGNWLESYCVEHSVERVTQLISPANRAQLTASRIRECMDSHVTEHHTVENLYLASSSDIVGVVCEQMSAHQNLMIIGHNPGMHRLVEAISGWQLKKFPTCAVACFSYDCDSWEGADRTTLVRTEMMRPKLLRQDPTSINDV